MPVHAEDRCPGWPVSRTSAAPWAVLLAWVALLFSSSVARGQGLEQGGPVDFGASPVGTPSGKISLNFNATVRTQISSVTPG